MLIFQGFVTIEDKKEQGHDFEDFTIRAVSEREAKKKVRVKINKKKNIKALSIELQSVSFA